MRHKVILFFASILAFIIFTNASCTPEDQNIVYFNVKNSSSDTIYIKSDFSVLENRVICIAPNTISNIKEGSFQDGEEDYKFKSLYNWTEADIFVYIYSKDSVLLKTWNKFYTDTYEKQFFRENDWEYKQYSKPNNNDCKYHDYTFEILPEDLNLK